ncbi:MAG: LytR C-terminal domain-containing protein [Thermodesulfovibrionales bacterium]|nr:LytR C-terminal domain-containing protein [Thermodesulfovibrionales bacterium]
MRHSWLVIVALTLTLSACASSKQMRETVASNAERIEMLQQQNNVLGTQFDGLASSIKQVEEKIDSLDGKLNAMAVDWAKGELREEVSDIEQRLTELENEGGLPEASSMAFSADDVSIKVLSGTGDMGSARVLAQKLMNEGYKVNRVDIAPTRFARNTVFYSEGFNSVAVEIADSISLHAVVRPLTWGSSFDIIVVTVE